MKLYMFWAVRLPIIRSLFTVHSAMVCWVYSLFTVCSAYHCGMFSK